LFPLVQKFAVSIRQKNISTAKGSLFAGKPSLGLVKPFFQFLLSLRVNWSVHGERKKKASVFASSASVRFQSPS
jgi:hypothetical protein